MEGCNATTTAIDGSTADGHSYKFNVSVNYHWLYRSVFEKWENALKVFKNEFVCGTAMMLTFCMNAVLKELK